MRKKPSFEELVKQSRYEILKDKELLDKIDEKVEERITTSFKKDA